ncbi:dienelactone hydrolase family protein [Luteimonas sp. SX5]|uniref:Dienelactone hydrolase family protein n=1 Tax=Luteimonas galliterrae TaxID=2940486 RepID=A0ABT0MJZ2_9GAMM|nr:dienelactone hydrolase family protein [Luteimonas galliterrae]MCL1635182.1 dienelactone hydrolase family protein [Luteimonas galliterrae]
MKSEPIEYKVGDDTFSGYLVYDDADKERRPGLVMVPNWMGATQDSVEKAKKIAGDDYVILIADVYGKGVRPKDSKEALAQVQKAYSDGGATLRRRAQAAVDTLKAQKGKLPVDDARIGAFGFCFGGSVALELARSGSDIKGGVVSLHGGLEGHVPIKDNKVNTPILVLNGADDSSVTDENIVAFQKEMDAARADWQFVDFSGAVHCFTQPESNDPPNCVYNEKAAKRAFRMMDDFFEEQFAAK